MKKQFGADWGNRKKDAVFFSLVIFVIVSAIWVNVAGRPGSDKFEAEKAFSVFSGEIKANKVASVHLARGNDGNDKLLVTGRDGNKYSVNYPTFEANIAQMLQDKDVLFEVNPRTSSTSFITSLIQISTLLMFVGFLYFVLKSTRMFDSSHFKRFDEKSDEVVTFADVAGVDEAKEALVDLVQYLKDPESFVQLGGRPPKGILLYGDPGNGKTRLARSVAGEAGVPFLWMTGSDFVEMFVGVGTARVKTLFAKAKKLAPCIIFIDEIDSVGRSRGAGHVDSAAEERASTLNRFLTEMDGFGGTTGIVVVAATNRPEVLDAALTRSGRFDRKVYVGRPDVKGREAILKVHARRFTLGADVDLAVVAKGTMGFSGADLENVLNQASSIAIRRGHDAVSLADIELAKDRIILGDERRSYFESMSDRARRAVATHECSHAVVAFHLNPSDPVERISIIPRGMSLGVTQQSQPEERETLDEKYLNEHLAVLMGGRVGEDLFLKVRTSGAAHDLATATKCARNMVCRWGMSDFGTLVIDDGSPGLAGGGRCSEATLLAADVEVRKLLSRAEEAARQCLVDHKEQVQGLVEKVMVHETLNSAQINEVLGSPSICVAPSAPEV